MEMRVFEGDRGELPYARWFKTPSGSVGEIAESHPGAGGMPADAVEISQEEYLTILAELEAGAQEHFASLLQADTARQAGDFQALVDVGIPAGTARRLSGWEGEA